MVILGGWVFLVSEVPLYHLCIVQGVSGRKECIPNSLEKSNGVLQGGHKQSRNCTHTSIAPVFFQWGRYEDLFDLTHLCTRFTNISWFYQSGAAAREKSEGW